MEISPLYIRFSYSIWVSFFIYIACTASTMTSGPLLVKRALPYESDPALLGYTHGEDYKFTPSLCETIQYTLTTVGNIVACCPSGSSACTVTTECSAGTAFATIVGRATAQSYFHSCSAYPYPAAGICQKAYIYDTFSVNVASLSATYTSIGCNYAPFPGVATLRRTLYRAVPTDSEVISTVTRYDPSTFNTPTKASSASSGTSKKVTSTSPSPASSTPTTQSIESAKLSSSSRTDTLTGQTTTSDTSTTLKSNMDSDSGLSKSDSIALGVGIGIGLPTIALTALTWWYPRRRRPAAQQPQTEEMLEQ